jgi:hypothetical protein
MDYQEIKDDFEDAYNLAWAGWSQYFLQAKRDLKFYQGDQWRADERLWLKDQGREAFVFNGIKRMVRIISGYERRNRHVLKVGPVGGEDDKACQQHTGVLMQIMNSNAGWPWMLLSDAFKFGSLITGMNLINLWPGRDGDIRFARNHYNKFLLDPTFTKLDLSDSDYLLRRELFTKEQAKRIVPAGVRKEIDKIKETGPDNKYPFMPNKLKHFGQDLTPYDEFWRRKEHKKKVVIFKGTFEQWPFEDFVKILGGDKAKANAVIANNPLFSTIDKYVDIVELAILFGGEVVWKGEDPYGIGDYPHVLVAGDWVPEEESSALKIQGIVRPARDPQKADNKRLSQMIDLCETVLGPGTDFEAGALVDDEDAYKAGAGQPRFFKAGAISGEKYKDRPGGDVPAGFVQLHQIFDRKIFEIPGINEELFGTEEKDIPFILGKLRTGAALTVFQDFFDNLRFAKKQLGRKAVRMVQSNYAPQKVQRLINEPPAEDFYRQDFVKYDCTLQEGLLTETQRQMAYAELRSLKMDGAPIPWAALIDMAPIQLKEHLKQYIAQAEQQQQQLAAEAQKEKMTLDQMRQAKIRADQGRAAERHAQVERDKASAALSNVKTIKEIQQFDTDRILSAIDRLIALGNLHNQSNKAGMTKR